MRRTTINFNSLMVCLVDEQRARVFGLEILAVRVCTVLNIAHNAAMDTTGEPVYSLEEGHGRRRYFCVVSTFCHVLKERQ